MMQASWTAQEALKLARFPLERAMAFQEISRIAEQLGQLPSAREALRQAQALLQDLVEEHGPLPQLQRARIVNWLNEGDILLRQGDRQEALEAFEASHALAMEQSLANPDFDEFTKDIALALERIAEIKIAADDIKGAQLDYERSLLQLQQLAVREPENQERQADYWTTCERLSHVARTNQDIDCVIRSLESGLPVARRLHVMRESEIDAIRTVAKAYMRLATAYRQRSRLSKALEACQSAIQIREMLAEKNPQQASKLMIDLARALEGAATVQREAKAYVEAAASLSRALDIRRKLADPSDDPVRAARDIAAALSRLAEVHRASGAFEHALSICRQVISMIQPLTWQFPDDIGLQSELADYFSIQSRCSEAARDLNAARRTQESAVELRRMVCEQDASSEPYLKTLSSGLVRLAELLTKMGDTSRARDTLQEDLAIAERLVRLAPGNLVYISDLAVSHAKLAQNAESRSRPDEAKTRYETAIEIFSRILKTAPNHGPSKRMLPIARKRIAALETLKSAQG